MTSRELLLALGISVQGKRAATGTWRRFEWTGPFHSGQYATVTIQKGGNWENGYPLGYPAQPFSLRLIGPDAPSSDPLRLIFSQGKSIFVCHVKRHVVWLHCPKEGIWLSNYSLSRISTNSIVFSPAISFRSLWYLSKQN